MPGAVVAGTLGAWLGCRRAGVRFGPVAGAAAPAVAFGQAIGRWGNWFSQELYGRPSSLPWAVEIDPAHRVIPYENYATFQPAFLYESLWDLALGLALIWAMRRFRLTGDRVFALYAAGVTPPAASPSGRGDSTSHLPARWPASATSGPGIASGLLLLVSLTVITTGRRETGHIGLHKRLSRGLLPMAAFRLPAPPGHIEGTILTKVVVSREPGVSRTSRSGDDCTGGVISV